MACQTRRMLVERMVAITFKKGSLNLRRSEDSSPATVMFVDIQHTSLTLSRNCRLKRALVQKSPITKLGDKTAKPYSNMIWCTAMYALCRERTGRYVPRIRTHCYAEVACALMQTDAQHRRAGRGVTGQADNKTSYRLPEWCR